MSGLILIHVISTELCLGCAGFAKKIFASKRNEIRFAYFLYAHAKFFPLLFASNFSLLIKAKLIERILNYFRFVSL